MSYIALPAATSGLRNSIEEVAAQHIFTRVTLDEESELWVVRYTLEFCNESKTLYYYSSKEYTEKEVVAKFYKDNGKRILKINGYIFFKSI